SRQSHRNGARRRLPIHRAKAGAPELTLTNTSTAASSSMTKTLFSICIWALVAWLIGQWINPQTGWAIVTFGLVSMILISGIQLSQIKRWVKNLAAPPPPSIGPWDEILAPIYRKLRANRQEIDEL